LLLLIKQIRRWEIYIPSNWKFGEWKSIRLLNDPVDTLVVKCQVCHKKFRVYPSFVIKGTTLTFSALVFCAFAYEYSKLTWRDLPEKFCEAIDKIAHSTIFKAVHGIGKYMTDDFDQIREGVAALAERFLPVDKGSNGTTPSIHLKSITEHTIRHELAVREMISPLAATGFRNFIFFFYTYLRALRKTLSGSDPPISKLYK
jgi:hypothetical protein